MKSLVDTRFDPQLLLQQVIRSGDMLGCKQRLAALSANLLIHGQPVQILTYDDFCAKLLKRLDLEHDLR